MKDITVEELLSLPTAVPIDVRSPAEHLESPIPGAINVPLFSNEERKEVGTLYKQAGEEAAKWRAMELVAPKIPQILGEIKKLTEEGFQPVIHCWRGGMRSQAIASFLEFSGIPAVRLIGGYRAYRQYVLERIPSLLPGKAVILHGLTGVGKTEILNSLQQKGYPVLDLERYANHKGSIFGSIGTGEGYNQKTFDGLLFQGLLDIQGSPYFLVEAESKRIGRASLPEQLVEKMANGIHFLITASTKTRINRIYEEYVLPFEKEKTYNDLVEEKVRKVERRIKNEHQRMLLDGALKNRDYRSVIKILMEFYYDPRYGHKQEEYEGNYITIDSNNLSAAVEATEKELLQLDFFPRTRGKGASIGK